MIVDRRSYQDKIRFLPTLPLAVTVILVLLSSSGGRSAEEGNSTGTLVPVGEGELVSECGCAEAESKATSSLSSISRDTAEGQCVGALSRDEKSSARLSQSASSASCRVDAGEGVIGGVMGRSQRLSGAVSSQTIRLGTEE